MPSASMTTTPNWYSRGTPTAIAVPAAFHLGSGLTSMLSIGPKHPAAHTLRGAVPSLLAVHTPGSAVPELVALSQLRQNASLLPSGDTTMGPVPG